jgi:hypothetical protein
VTALVKNQQETHLHPDRANAWASVAMELELANHQVIAKPEPARSSRPRAIPNHRDQGQGEGGGIDLCFVEINYCMIMTPLTAFRGHQHKAHPGGIHNHDAPDPPGAGL